MENVKLTYEELLIQNKNLKKELLENRKQDFLKLDLSSEVEFKDLFNVDEIQNIQDLFAESTGVASLITHPNGIPITKPSNFCRLCKDIIRKTEKGLKNCYHSGAEIGKQNNKGVVYRPCLSCGLWDGSVIISVGGKHVANWLIGQVKNENTDVDKMLLYAKEIGADENEFKNALEEVNTMSTAKFKKVVDTLFFFANEISNKAYQNIQQKHYISELKERKKQLIKAKEKAEKNQKLYKDLVQSSHNLIWKCDLEGKFTFLNAAWENTHGYKIEEMLGKPFSNFQRPEVFKRDVIEFTKHLKGGFVKGYETTHIIKDGTEIPLIFNALPLLNTSGDIIGTQGTAFDISKLKKTEFELIAAKEKAEESDELKTEFIHNMSHEIRTPMNGILGFSEMLSNDNISDEKRANFVKIIKSSGQQLLSVIDDILEISRLGTKQVKVIESDVCLNDVMLELFSTFDIKAKKQKKPLYFEKVLSDRQSTIKTDITKLIKVLSILLENALKFTNQGFIEFGYQLINNNIKLYVKDTGIGIEKSKHKLIFERFSQAEKDLSKNVGGLGLGLSIAKENVELLGGSIQLESKEGKGSTFFVTIPYKPVYKVNDTEKSTLEPKYTILIAEDEEINYLYLETLLKDINNLDCKIIHVTNGKDAVEACNENKTIDFILMDIKMPILNGFEATKLIKKLRPNIPVIAQTAYSTPQEKEKAFLVGCNDFISKPILQESLKAILDKYLIIK